MTNLIQVHITAGSEDEAFKIADRLLTDRLAACVQIHGPIRSRYWWQGELEEAVEWACSVKTVAEKYPQVENTVRQVHSYDEPEIVASAIAHVSAGYGKWVAETVGDSAAG